MLMWKDRLITKINLVASYHQFVQCELIECSVNTVKCQSLMGKTVK